jgi:hypothetical protein
MHPAGAKTRAGETIARGAKRALKAHHKSDEVLKLEMKIRGRN